jgi:hypothetical protein
VMFAMGWHFLLVPAGIIAALMLVLIWLKRLRGEKRSAKQ